MAAKTKATKKKTESASVPVKRSARAEPKKGELMMHGRTPWRLFEEVRDEMEDFWRGARNWPAFPHFPKLIGRETTGWLPSTDVYRTNGDLVVKADLPGLTKENVEVMV
ncbi:MAG TPA: hypothetical protein VMN39_10650, partial [Longimicrobiaceae bacterium]|nr:hypothetical protein [Longimicrobiaceae bacterium]